MFLGDINIRDEGLRMLASGIGASAGGGNVRRKLSRKTQLTQMPLKPERIVR